MPAEGSPRIYDRLPARVVAGCFCYCNSLRFCSPWAAAVTLSLLFLLLLDEQYIAGGSRAEATCSIYIWTVEGHLVTRLEGPQVR